VGRLAVRAAHAGGQIVGADEHGVDAGDRENLVEVADGLDVLALQDDQDFVVGVGVVIGRVGVEVQGVDAPADAAVAGGRVEAGGDGLQRLVPGVDHRHDDPVSAVVEYPLVVVVSPGLHAVEGYSPGVGV